MGVPKSEPSRGCGPQGMGVDREGAVAIRVTLSAGTDQWSSFYFVKSWGRKAGCKAPFSKESCWTWVLLPAAGQLHLQCSKMIWKKGKGSERGDAEGTLPSPPLPWVTPVPGNTGLKEGAGWLTLHCLVRGMLVFPERLAHRWGWHTGGPWKGDERNQWAWRQLLCVRVVVLRVDLGRTGRSSRCPEWRWAAASQGWRWRWGPRILGASWRKCLPTSAPWRSWSPGFLGYTSTPIPILLAQCQRLLSLPPESLHSPSPRRSGVGLKGPWGRFQDSSSSWLSRPFTSASRCSTVFSTF